MPRNWRLSRRRPIHQNLYGRTRLPPGYYRRRQRFVPQRRLYQRRAFLRLTAPLRRRFYRNLVRQNRHPPQWAPPRDNYYARLRAARVRSRRFGFRHSARHARMFGRTRRLMGDPYIQQERRELEAFDAQTNPDLQRAVEETSDEAIDRYLNEMNNE